MSENVDINNLLDEIIKVTGLTQEEVAQRINYRPDYLSQARNAGTQKLFNKLESFSKEFMKSKLSKEGKEPETITELLQNNRVLSEANRTLADANKILADAHNSIVQLAREAIWANSNKSATVAPPILPEGGTKQAVDELRHTGRTGPFSGKKKDRQQDNAK